MTLEDLEAMTQLPPKGQLHALEDYRRKIDAAMKHFVETLDGEEDMRLKMQEYMTVCGHLITHGNRDYSGFIARQAESTLTISDTIINHRGEGIEERRKALPPMDVDWIRPVMPLHRLAVLPVDQLFIELETSRAALDTCLKDAVSGKQITKDELLIAYDDFIWINLEATERAARPRKRRLNRQGEMAINRLRRVITALEEGPESLAELAESLPKMSDAWIYSVSEGSK